MRRVAAEAIEGEALVAAAAAAGERRVDDVRLAGQLLLIPLGPVDLDLLADAAKIYTEITSVPVIVRKLREPWAPGQPDRPGRSGTIIKPERLLSRNDY